MLMNNKYQHAPSTQETEPDIIDNIIRFSTENFETQVNNEQQFQADEQFEVNKSMEKPFFSEMPAQVHPPSIMIPHAQASQSIPLKPLMHSQSQVNVGPKAGNRLYMAQKEAAGRNLSTLRADRSVSALDQNSQTMSQLLPSIGVQRPGLAGSTSNSALMQSKISLIRDKNNASLNDLFKKGNGNSTLHLARRSNQPLQHASSTSRMGPSVQLPQLPQVAQRQSYRDLQALSYGGGGDSERRGGMMGLQRSSLSLKFQRLSHMPRENHVDDRFSTQNLEQMISKIQLIQKMQEAYEALQQRKEIAIRQESDDPQESRTLDRVDSQYVIKLNDENQKQPEGVEKNQQQKNWQKNRKAVSQKRSKEVEPEQKSKKIVIIGKNVKQSERSKNTMSSAKVDSKNRRLSKMKIENANDDKQMVETVNMDSVQSSYLVNHQNGDQSYRQSQLEYYHQNKEHSLSPVPIYEMKTATKVWNANQKKVSISSRSHTSKALNTSERRKSNQDEYNEYKTNNEKFMLKQTKNNINQLVRENSQMIPNIETLYSKRSEDLVLDLRALKQRSPDQRSPPQRSPPTKNKQYLPALTVTSTQNLLKAGGTAQKTQSSEGGFSESLNIRSHKYQRAMHADSDGFNIKDLVRQSFQIGQIQEEQSVERLNSAEQLAKRDQAQDDKKAADSNNSEVKVNKDLKDQLTGPMTAQTSIQKTEDSLASINPDKVTQFHEVINIQNLQRDKANYIYSDNEKELQSKQIRKQVQLSRTNEDGGVPIDYKAKAKPANKTDRKRQAINPSKAQSSTWKDLQQKWQLANQEQQMFQINNTQNNYTKRTNQGKLSRLPQSSSRNALGNPYEQSSLNEHQVLTRSKSNQLGSFTLQGTAYQQSTTQQKDQVQVKNLIPVDLKHVKSIDTEKEEQSMSEKQQKTQRDKANLEKQQRLTGLSQSQTKQSFQQSPRKQGDKSPHSPKRQSDEVQIFEQLNEFLRNSNSSLDDQIQVDAAAEKQLSYQHQPEINQKQIEQLRQVLQTFEQNQLSLMKRKMIWDSQQKSQRLTRNYSDDAFNVDHVMSIKNYNPQFTKMEYEKSTNTLQSLQNILTNRNFKNDYSDFQLLNTRLDDSEDTHSYRYQEKSRQNLKVRVSQDLDQNKVLETESLELPLNKSHEAIPFEKSQIFNKSSQNINYSNQQVKDKSGQAAIFQSAKSYLNLEEPPAGMPVHSLQNHMRNRSNSKMINSQMYLRFVENYYMQDNKPTDYSVYGKDSNLDSPFIGHTNLNNRYLEKERELSEHLRDQNGKNDYDNNLRKEILNKRVAYKGNGSLGIRSERQSIYNTQIERQSRDFGPQTNVLVKSKINLQEHQNQQTGQSTSGGYVDHSQILGNVYSPQIMTRQSHDSRNQLHQITSKFDDNDMKIMIRKNSQETSNVEQELLDRNNSQNGQNEQNGLQRERSESMELLKRRRSTMKLQKSSNDNSVVKVEEDPKDKNIKQIKITKDAAKVPKKSSTLVGNKKPEPEYKENGQNNSIDPPYNNSHGKNFSNVKLASSNKSKKSQNEKYQGVKLNSKLESQQSIQKDKEGSTSDAQRLGVSIESITVGTGPEILQIKPKPANSDSKTKETAQIMDREDEGSENLSQSKNVVPKTETKLKSEEKVEQQPINQDSSEEEGQGEPKTARRREAKTDPDVHEPFLAYSNQELDQGTLQPGQKPDQQDDFTFDGNMASSLQVSTGKQSTKEKKAANPVLSAVVTKQVTPQEMRTDLRHYRNSSAGEVPEVSSPRRHEISQFQTSLQKLEQKLKVNMDGYSSLQEFLSALPALSELKNQNLATGLLADSSLLASPSKDRGEFDQMGHRRKLLRYRVTGKLSAAIRELEETQRTRAVSEQKNYLQQSNTFDQSGELKLVAQKKNINVLKTTGTDNLRQSKQRKTEMKNVGGSPNREESDIETAQNKNTQLPSFRETKHKMVKNHSSAIVIENQQKFKAQDMILDQTSYKIVSQQASDPNSPQQKKEFFNRQLDQMMTLKTSDQVSFVSDPYHSNNYAMISKWNHKIKTNVTNSGQDWQKVSNQKRVDKKQHLEDKKLSYEEKMAYNKQLTVSSTLTPVQTTPRNQQDADESPSRTTVNYQTNMVNEDLAKHYLMLQMLLCGRGNRSSLQERCRLLRQMILRLGQDIDTGNINQQNQTVQMKRDFEAILATLDQKDRSRVNTQTNKAKESPQKKPNMKPLQPQQPPTYQDAALQIKLVESPKLPIKQLPTQSIKNNEGNIHTGVERTQNPSFRAAAMKSKAAYMQANDSAGALQGRQSKRSGFRMQTLTAEDLSIRGSEYGGAGGAAPLIGNSINIQLSLNERGPHHKAQSSRGRGLNAKETQGAPSSDNTGPLNYTEKTVDARDRAGDDPRNGMNIERYDDL